MIKIDSYAHVCIIQNGHMAGNTYRHKVDGYDYEREETCPHCEEPLVTTRQLIAHIYRQLTCE
jgi:hypothetical protein